MTYQKKAPDTLIGKMGFTDPELASPAHDDMVLALTARRLAAYLNSHELSAIGPSRGTWTGPWDVGQVHHEVPISDGKWVSGFIDVWAYAKRPYDEYVNVAPIKYGAPTTQRLDHDTYLCNFLIEVKPEIKSYGELLRQINFYKNKIVTSRNSYGTSHGRCSFGVATSAASYAKFAEQLQSQDIFCINAGSHYDIPELE